MIGIGKKSRSKAAPAAVEQTLPEPAAHTPAEQARQLEAELQEARSDLALVEGELGIARAEYARAADATDIGAALAARARVNEAEVGIDVCLRAVERLKAELATLLDGLADATELAERERLRAEAEAACAAYQAAFLKHMPVLTAQSRGLVRLWAEAEIACEAAAAKGLALPRPDAFRDEPGSPRVEVKRRELDLWINPNSGDPYDDSRQEQIRRQSDGRGSLVGRNHTTTIDRKRRFMEVTFRPGSPARRAPILAEHLLIPAETASSHVGWAWPKGSDGFTYGFSARAVLKTLDALEAPRPAAPEPELRTERKPTEPARDVALQGEVPRIPLLRGIG